MATWKAILDLIQILKLIPESVVPVEHIGLTRPKKREDLPAVVVSMGEIEETPIGIGGMVATEQTSGGQWTETTGRRFSGSLNIEVWAEDEDGLTQLADGLFEVLENSDGAIRDKGFIKFGHYKVNPVEHVTVARQDTLQMVIAYSVVYEKIKTDTVEPDGVIRKLHIEIDEEFDEKMDLS